MSTLSQYVHQQYMKLSTIYFSISYGLKSQESLNLSNASAIDQNEADSSIVENESFESGDDSLNAHRAAGYETILVPEIPRIYEDDN